MRNSLIRALSTDQRRTLENVREATTRIWAQPLHRYFTDHTVTHCERIIALLDGLTVGIMDSDKSLSSSEIFVLLLATYLHDIGMQNERFAGGNLDEIRKHHNEQTAEMIYAVFEDRENAFRIPLVRDPAVVEAVALVAKGHRAVDLTAPEYDPLFHGGESIRLRLLGGLLRFGDELDIDHRRVDLEQMKLLTLPVDSQLHWWKCHYVSGVSIVDEYIRISYRFPKDRPDYEELIVPLVEKEIRNKLASLEEIFRVNGAKIAMGKPQVRLMRLVQPLPPGVETLARGIVGTKTQKAALRASDPVGSPKPRPRQSAHLEDIISVKIAALETVWQPFIPEMVPIPSGEFLMGSNPLKDPKALGNEQPQQSVYLEDYYLAKTPTTNAQYAAFVEATDHDPPKPWKRRKPPTGKENHPATAISWYDAVAYCRWLSDVTGEPFRLPSEAEWEKGARSSLGLIYPWGNHWVAEYCNTDEAGIGATTEVDRYPQACSPYGLLDMAGNVWEWTITIWGKCREAPEFTYPYDSSDGRENVGKIGKVFRVVRGGAFFHDKGWARCASRIGYLSDYGEFSVGFRVAISK